MRASRAVVLRVFVTLLLIVSGTAALAEPVAMPRFRITNRTTLEVAGSFYVMYLAADTPTVNGTRTSTTLRLDNIRLAPGASTERNFPTRIDHPAGVSTRPSISGAGPVDCKFMLGGQQVNWPNSMCHTLGLHMYPANRPNGNTFLWFDVAIGSTSSTSQDYCDVTIEWRQQ
jgi:hypothetical protein